jgi:hypothetical protein
LRTFINTNTLFPQLKTQIYAQFNALLDTSTQIMQNYYNIKKFNYNKIQDDDDEIIIKLNEVNNSKIIIMGDQHGSFHSFFRLISRLIIEGIMDNNYVLQQNYKIIFLGDIVDRGNFGIEIMYIILRLFVANNNENELKIIINRGNHEEGNIFSKYGFTEEINHKLRNTVTITRKFVNFYKYCSSAIILNPNNMKYWLCHGGFSLDNSINFNSNDNIYLNRLFGNFSQIRWNDFNNKSANGRGRAPDCFSIGTISLIQFLNTYNINFIIRGHQDSDSNAMLLSVKNTEFNPMGAFNTSSNDFFDINVIANKILLEESPNSNLITYSVSTPKSDNEIATINTTLFECGSQLLYPVLTISNNCDIQRYLYNDSYVIIESFTQNGGTIKKITINLIN